PWVALSVVGTPHGRRERSGRKRQHLLRLVAVDQPHFGQPGAVCLLDERAQRWQLGGIVAKVDVAGEAQLAVGLVAELPPKFDRLLGDRELCGVTALESKRALRPARALAG